MTGTTTTHTLLERNYRLFTPDGIGANAPLVICLHPGLSNAQAFQTGVSSLNNTLDDAAFTHSTKFYVAYPNGTGRVIGSNVLLTWNAGWCCGYAHEAKKNDILFIKNLRTKLLANYSIDSTKVYLAGYSNGGFLAYSILGTNPTLWAGAVIAAGALKKDYDELAGTINLDITHVWGTLDTIVNPEGSPNSGDSQIYGSYHDSLSNMFAELTSRGATINQIELTGAEHSFASIQAYLASQESTDFATLVTDMI